MPKKLRTRRHSVVLNRSAGGDTIITVIMVIFGILMVFPLYVVIMNSFKPAAEAALSPPRFYVMKPTFKAYIDLFTNVNTSWVPLSRLAFNSLFYTVGIVAGSLVIGSLSAYAISVVKFPGSKGLMNLIVYSMMIGSTLGGLVQFIIFIKLGWCNTYAVTIIPSWVSTTGLYLMKNFLDGNVPVEMLEAARLDGASEPFIFMRIVMPMAKPAWMTLMFTTFQGCWGGGVSGYVWDPSLGTFSLGGGGAGGVLMMVVPITVFIITQSQIMETMGSAGMKD